MAADREQSVSNENSGQIRALVAAERALAEALRLHGPGSVQTRTARERWVQANVFSGSCIDPS